MLADSPRASAIDHEWPRIVSEQSPGPQSLVARQLDLRVRYVGLLLRDPWLASYVENLDQLVNAGSQRSTALEPDLFFEPSLPSFLTVRAAASIAQLPDLDFEVDF